MTDFREPGIVSVCRAAVTAVMLMSPGCTTESAPLPPSVSSTNAQDQMEGAEPVKLENRQSADLTSAMPPQDETASIDLQSDTRKFAYVMFQYQRLLACSQTKVQQTLPLSDVELHALQESIGEAQDAWDGVRKRAFPPEEFFVRFLPRAQAFDRLFGENISTEKRLALLPTIIQEHRGAIVFLLPEVPQAIGLTDAQLVKIEEIVDRTARQFDWTNITLLQVPKLLRLSAADREQVEAMMDESQLRRWKSLLKP